MMKKANKDAIKIKSLIKADIPQIQIAELLGISKLKVNYWKKEITTVQIHRKKLDFSYIQKIC